MINPVFYNATKVGVETSLEKDSLKLEFDEYEDVEINTTKVVVDSITVENGKVGE